MRDDDWRMTEHSDHVAMGEAYQWASVARVQVARVIDPDPAMWQARVPDAYVAVSAVRKVRQAAAMALEHLTNPAARAQLGEAIEDFDRELPGVKDARDVLEHFDEYTRGVGDLQQPSVRRRHQREPDEGLAERYRPTLDHIHDDPQRPRVTVGPAVVDLVGAAELASVLVHEIYAAIRTEEGQPYGRELVAGFLGVPARMAGVVRR